MRCFINICLIKLKPEKARYFIMTKTFISFFFLSFSSYKRVSWLTQWVHKPSFPNQISVRILSWNTQFSEPGNYVINLLQKIFSIPGELGLTLHGAMEHQPESYNRGFRYVWWRLLQSKEIWFCQWVIFFVSMLFALSGFYLFYKIKDEKGLETTWEVA